MIDFLVFYLTKWFTKRQKNLSTSSPLEQGLYALTICSILWFFTLWQIVFYFLSRTHYHSIPLYMLLIWGIFVYLCLNSVYIKFGRYDFVVNKFSRKKNISETNYNLIIICFALISTLLPFFIAIIISINSNG